MNDKCSYLKTLSVIIFGAIVFWVLAVCALEIFDFGIIDEKGIVLTLVGILATFVVVSNYIQVTEIKNSFDKEITKIRNERIRDNKQFVEALYGLMERNSDIFETLNLINIAEMSDEELSKTNIKEILFNLSAIRILLTFEEDNKASDKARKYFDAMKSRIEESKLNLNFTTSDNSKKAIITLCLRMNNKHPLKSEILGYLSMKITDFGSLYEKYNNNSSNW